MFSMAMWMAALVAPVQILAGDQHGLNTLKHQPAKIMAMEGHYESHADGAPLYLFGIPERRASSGSTMRSEFPRSGSLLLKHDPNAPMAGLDTVPDEDQPPVRDHLLVVPDHGRDRLPDARPWPVEPGRARARGRLYDWPLLHRAAIVMAPSGFVAVIAGWVTTEVGRQPFTVYGLLRTADSVSPLAAPAVGASLARVRAGLFRRVRGRHLVHTEADGKPPPHAHETGLAQDEQQGPLRSGGNHTRAGQRPEMTP